mmetsp:Transcript_56481/g.157428  ORF Transcript_56481/g.157428 Transcript_56481/m.157428 type:complete len:354 (+) Transcript_56481:246-1307(+)
MKSSCFSIMRMRLIFSCLDRGQSQEALSGGNSTATGAGRSSTSMAQSASGPKKFASSTTRPTDSGCAIAISSVAASLQMHASWLVSSSSMPPSPLSSTSLLSFASSCSTSTVTSSASSTAAPAAAMAAVPTVRRMGPSSEVQAAAGHEIQDCRRVPRPRPSSTSCSVPLSSSALSRNTESRYSSGTQRLPEAGLSASDVVTSCASAFASEEWTMSRIDMKAQSGSSADSKASTSLAFVSVNSHSHAASGSPSLRSNARRAATGEKPRAQMLSIFDSSMAPLFLTQKLEPFVPPPPAFFGLHVTASGDGTDAAAATALAFMVWTVEAPLSRMVLKTDVPSSFTRRALDCKTAVR